MAVLSDDQATAEALHALGSAGALVLRVIPGVEPVSITDLEQRGTIRSRQDPFISGGGI